MSSFVYRSFHEQPDSEPRVWYHDKQWRLRFVVAPTEQLCINF